MSKKVKIVPRGKQVLVEQDEEQSRESEYGIVTPDNVEQETKAFGTVVAVGPEIEDIKVGDRVIYAMFGGEQIELDETDYMLLFEEDVLAFIK